MRNYPVPTLIISLVLLTASACTGLPTRPTVTRLAPSSLAPVAPAGFSRADGSRPLTFPADYGPHPDYQTEWWYYTGNLQTAEGRHFGYQLTFFRRALVPPVEVTGRPSAWAASQAYLAHFALSDITGSQHVAFERLTRGAVGLAGAQAVPFAVWLEDWRVEEIAPDQDCPAGVIPPCRYRMQAAQDSIRLDLVLEDLKGPILQGNQGFSPKGPEIGQASYYFSFTRLRTSGVAQVGDQAFDVTGFSWMDHEFSTSALALDQIGWDWFSLQLDDGSEIMVFQIRQADGSIDPFSSGTVISRDGRTTTLGKEDFALSVFRQWRSPETRAVYPAGWTLNIPQIQLTLEITPLLADQELNLTYNYWEGAVSFRGSLAGSSVQGFGYVELTGYAGSMGGEF